MANRTEINKRRDELADPKFLGPIEAYYKGEAGGRIGREYLALDPAKFADLKLRDDKNALMGQMFNPLPGVAPQQEISSPGDKSRSA